jgi:hypothetical protein
VSKAWQYARQESICSHEKREMHERKPCKYDALTPPLHNEKANWAKERIAEWKRTAEQHMHK